MVLVKFIRKAKLSIVKSAINMLEYAPNATEQAITRIKEKLASANITDE
jgi:hypothetical protein